MGGKELRILFLISSGTFSKLDIASSESKLLVPVDMDREEVANLFENYNLNSAAVVDKTTSLLV